MKKFAFDINDINKNKPSIEESNQKLEKYELKSKLGLFELFDENNSISEKDIKDAGFTNLTEYETLRIKTINMIDNNIAIPDDIAKKLMKVIIGHLTKHKERA